MDKNKTDYSQYQSWEPVQMPSGAVYYIVPGGSGWAYDPFTSSQTGRVQLFPNPKPKLAAEAQAQQEQADQIKAAKQAASPGNQFMQMAAPVGVGLLGKYAYDNWLNPTKISPTQQLSDALANQRLAGINNSATQQLANIPAQYGGTQGVTTQPSLWDNISSIWGGNSAPASSTQQAFSSGAAPQGNMFDMPLEQALQTQDYPSTPFTQIGSTPGPIAPGFAMEGPDFMSGFSGPSPLSEPLASNGLQTYGGSSASTSGAAPVGWLAQAPGTNVMGSTGFGSMLPGLGIAAGAAVGMSQLGGLKDMFAGRKLKTKEKLTLALPTFGLSLISNSIPGFTHKSTKEHEAERWGKLADNGITGAQQAFMAAHNPDDDGKWKEGLGAGQDWNFETAIERAKMNPSEFRGAYGNFDTFGNDWATYNPSQQDEIVKRLIDANLYDPEKGDITISDKDQARKIKDQVLSNDPQTSLIKPPNPSDNVKPQSNTPSINAPIPGLSSAPTAAPGIPGGFKPLSITPTIGAPATTTIVGPQPQATNQNIGKQLAQRFNKFGEPS